MGILNKVYKKLILQACDKKTFKGEIQRKTGITFVTVTTHMKKLEKEGFIKVMQSTDGRCGQMYKITGKGKKFLLKCSKIIS